MKTFLATIKKRLIAIANIYLIYKSGFFDREWYRAKNPDVVASKIPLIVHYYFFGGFEGRDPSSKFSSSWYLKNHQDEKSIAINPLVHFLKYGKDDKEIERQLQPPILKLMKMYDYAKKHNNLIFKGETEVIYLQRPKVLGNYSGTLQEGYANCPLPYVSLLKNAIVFGGSSLVISKEGIVLSDELVDFNDHAFGTKMPLIMQLDKDTITLNFNKHKLQPSIKIEEGILLSCGHDMNYFHWIVECLPKLLLLDELNLYTDTPLLIPKGLHENLVTSLNKVNINNRQLIYIEPNAPYRVKKLIFPSALSRVVDRYEGTPAFDIDIILSHIWITKVSELLQKNMQTEQEPWRKLFLTRREGLRALGNREEVERMLSTHGFEIVDLMNASLDSQIELLSQASIVVAPTGAALTNMLFCKPGTKVIIFMSNHEVTNYYFWSNLGAAMKLDVTIIAGERLFNLTDYWSVHDDYVIDAKLVIKEI